jgi:predicted CoA-substrate-specific enzyme activase
MSRAAAALGIDAGSTTAKIVAVDARGEMVWHHLEPADPRMAEQVDRFLEIARDEAQAIDRPLVGTGYGRDLVRAAGRRVTEITCHARGVFRATGRGGTLIDIGGQDSKVIVIDASGNVENFAMNDKCAAGTGRFLDVVAGRLRVPLEEMGGVALAASGEVSISSTCTVFAESEIVSLIAHGHPVEHIVRGLHRSLIRRIASLARSAGLSPPVMLSGGVALNPAVPKILSEELDQEVLLPHHPQLMGAYGAALIALETALGEKPGRAPVLA